MQEKLFDVVIVGGGPAGTATAFRARELGLDALVIDYDDLMKRIRDYSKDKLILPSFGGGHRMGFPCGDELVSSLCFDPIDKDALCQSWKTLYEHHRIPFRTGIELTGLERQGAHWSVQTWDHGNHRELELRARHLVIAIGRGVPRRFDIPGNTDGIAFRLTSARQYLGQPTCVIGGGTSAAEAVIAISRAKSEASDPTSVYWSYRGERMPRVSRALAEVFFEAYVGIGNIRYFPLSEPTMVVTGDDHQEYLTLRVDRRMMPGRPAETTHLEFPKAHCLACIGEDIPETLLRAIGIPMIVGGPQAKKRMVVTRCLESVQPDVYLIGDLLSQAYFETDEFDADPATFRELKHRGNIKAALRDGVLVAQVIRQKLDGKGEISVQIEETEVEEAPRSQVLPVFVPDEQDGPPASSLDSSRQIITGSAFLVRQLPGGVEGEEYPLPEHSAITLGRDACDLSFPDDTSLAPRHASVVHSEAGYFLRDDGGQGGVFLSVPSSTKMTLTEGDVLCAGHQFLLVLSTTNGCAIAHYDATGREIARHDLGERALILGRQAPDITLDPDDRTLSRRQLAISCANGKVLAKDLRSVNGTYLRVRETVKLEHGARFRIGRQSFVFSLRDGAPLDAGAAPMQDAGLTPAPPPQPITDGAPSVTFHGLGKTFPVQPGQTLCEVAEANGIKICAECHAGICGSDPIRILAGQEHFAPQSDQEAETLEDLCELEAGQHRLACMSRITGPVTIELLE